MMKKLYSEKRFSDFRGIINHSAAHFGRRCAFETKTQDGTSRKVTYRELRERFYTLCNRFLADGLCGRRIAVIGKNSFEWVLSYLAAATVGVVVPLDRELQGGDIENFLRSADCAAFCADEEATKKVSPDLLSGMHEYRFSDLSALSEGKNVACEAVDALTIRPDETQILIFTSGTTGNAKGVCLSQFAVCSDIYSTVRAVRIRKKDVTLSILPLHHTYECTLNCLLILSRGAKITYCDGLTKIQKNLTEYSPSVLVVVPALLKMLNKRIRASLAKECPEKYRTLFETETLADALRKIPFPVRRIIRAKVRASLGGNLRLFIVGAAALDTGLVEDFLAIGIRTLQGYGLTECAPLLAGNNDFYLNPASTGVAMPGIRLKIDHPSADGVGEILAKGDNIMLGYFNDPEATKRVFRDGWFCTGDLGQMDPDGALYIRGRIKNVIVTENGKNIYPEELETRIALHPEIGEVLVVGINDEKKSETHIKAKIFPNLDFIKKLLGHIPTKQEIEEYIRKVINVVNKEMPGYKRISVIDILTSPFEKTTTQKIRRYGANLA